MTRPALLWLTPEPPLPPSSGMRLRSLSLIATAAERFDITCGLFNTSPGDELRSLSAIEWVELGVATRRQQIASLPYMAAWTAPGPTRYFSAPAQRRSARELLSSRHYAAVVCDHPLTAMCLPRKLDIPLIINTHNVEREVVRKQTQAEAGGRVFLLVNRLTIGLWERRTLHRAQGLAFCSGRDRDLLLPALRPHAVTAIVPNAVDTERQTPLERPATLDRVVFVGTGTYQPNIEAIAFIREHLGPAAKAAGLTISVVGADGPSSPGVRFAGRVDDLRAEYAGAFASVAPLFSGSGTRLKILESFAFGRPVVATRKAAEGLGLQPGEHYLAAENAAEFVAQLTKLQDPDVWEALSRRAREYVCENHSWAVAGDAFSELVDRVLAQPTASASSGS